MVWEFRLCLIEVPGGLSLITCHGSFVYTQMETNSHDLTGPRPNAWASGTMLTSLEVSFDYQGLTWPHRLVADSGHKGHLST